MGRGGNRLRRPIIILVRPRGGGRDIPVRARCGEARVRGVPLLLLRRQVPHRIRTALTQQGRLRARRAPLGLLSVSRQRQPVWCKEETEN